MVERIAKNSLTGPMCLPKVTEFCTSADCRITCCGSEQDLRVGVDSGLEVVIYAPSFKVCPATFRVACERTGSDQRPFERARCSDPVGDGFADGSGARADGGNGSSQWRHNRPNRRGDLGRYHQSDQRGHRRKPIGAVGAEWQLLSSVVAAWRLSS